MTYVINIKNSEFFFRGILPLPRLIGQSICRIFRIAVSGEMKGRERTFKVMKRVILIDKFLKNILDINGKIIIWSTGGNSDEKNGMNLMGL